MGFVLIPVPIPDFAQPAAPGRYHPLIGQPRSPLSPPMTPIDKLMWRDVILPMKMSAATTQIPAESSRPIPSGKENRGPSGSGGCGVSVARKSQKPLRPALLPARNDAAVARSESTTNALIELTRKAERHEPSLPLPTTSKRGKKKKVRFEDDATPAGSEIPAATDSELRELIQEWPMPSGVWADDHGEADTLPKAWGWAFEVEIRNIELRSLVKNWPVATGVWAGGKQHNKGVRWPKAWFAPPPDPTPPKTQTELPGKTKGKGTKKSKRKNNRRNGRKRR